MKKQFFLNNQDFINFNKNLILSFDEFKLKTGLSDLNNINLFTIFRIINQENNEYFFAKISKIDKNVQFKKVILSLDDFDTFVFDMDGTLLDNNKKIVEKNLVALNKLREKGKNICIATGRAIFMLDKYLDQIPYNLPFLCANGSMVYDHKSLSLISESKIDKNTAYKIMDKCQELNLGYYVFLPNSLIGMNVENTSEYKLRRYDQTLKPGQWDLNVDRSYFDDKTICKILISFEPEEQQQDLDKLAEFIKNFNEIIGVQTQKNFFDIGEPCSKASALVFISDKYNINLEKTVAFGDANNDAPTFDVVALSCAPSSSMPNAINKATFVSKQDNNSAWINDFIEQNFQ
ncbi:Hypothetical protein, putative COF family HAD hydrolase [Mycoplasmopsis bovigenitalium 51080]|uniref:Uncharacterized protein n=1 Tax=Mycoplasmopsis bovigenitalium 51080 TaxID=1188235 RepID=N9VBW3_9BACT|nr:Cof-type HAD-IIB family hydrolase [Mycoplasmopsis bovigenitalium]ENY68916.1 Hypothetical protein, putative COF family HAD hydrolase [Mycoplasmopsis bovigenitalium 51080]